MDKKYNVHYQERGRTGKPKFGLGRVVDQLDLTGTSNGVNRKGVIVNPEINFFYLQTWGLDHCFIETLLTEDELFDLLRQQGYNPIWTQKQ
jgi:hypothetical protein